MKNEERKTILSHSIPFQGRINRMDSHRIASSDIRATADPRRARTKQTGDSREPCEQVPPPNDEWSIDAAQQAAP